MVNPTAVRRFLGSRLAQARRDDRGAIITTEIAVVIFVVVAGAILVVGILMSAAEDNARNVEVPTQQQPQDP